ncbi:unnamed protein product [Amoebophrya sp. A120]|nr:unnamed protein product [Amoebophrya sp. A120]|eukprot:GSA120T00008035001.1
MGQSIYLPAANKEKETAEGQGKGGRWRFGFSAMQGWRRSMEDAHIHLPDFADNLALFAVFDGHGGAAVAQLVAQKFPEILKSQEAFGDQNYQEALRAAFIAMDKYLDSAEGRKELRIIGAKAEKEKKDDDDDVRHRGSILQQLLRDQQVLDEEDILNANYLEYGADEEDEDGIKTPPAVTGMPPAQVIALEDKKKKKDVVDIKIEESESLSVSPQKNGETRPTTNGPIIEVGNGPATSSSKSPKDKENENKAIIGPAMPPNGMIGPAMPPNGKLPTSSEEEKSPGSAGAKDKEPREKNAKSPGGSRGQEQLPLDKTGLDFAKSIDELTNRTSLEQDDDDIDDIFVMNKNKTEAAEAKAKKEEDSDSSSGDEFFIGPQPPKKGLNPDDDDDDDDDLKVEDLLAGGLFDDGPSGINPESQGCTANVVLLQYDDKMDQMVAFCANAGDSRAVLCRQGAGVPLSFDHKPTNPSERERILASGGTVSEEGRVDSNLNLSRAMGDLIYKDKALAPEAQRICVVPDVSVTHLSGDDNYLIIGCDGIFEKQSNESLVAWCNDRIYKHRAAKGSGDAEVDVELNAVCSDFLNFNVAESPSTDMGVGCDNMSMMIVRPVPGAPLLAGRALAAASEQQQKETENTNSSEEKSTSDVVVAAAAGGLSSDGVATTTNTASKSPVDAEPEPKRSKVEVEGAHSTSNLSSPAASAVSENSDADSTSNSEKTTDSINALTSNLSVEDNVPAGQDFGAGRTCTTSEQLVPPAGAAANTASVLCGTETLTSDASSVVVIKTTPLESKVEEQSELCSTAPSTCSPTSATAAVTATGGEEEDSSSTAKKIKEAVEAIPLIETAAAA